MTLLMRCIVALLKQSIRSLKGFVSFLTAQIKPKILIPSAVPGIGAVSSKKVQVMLLQVISNEMNRGKWLQLQRRKKITIVSLLKSLVWIRILTFCLKQGAIGPRGDMFLQEKKKPYINLDWILTSDNPFNAHLIRSRKVPTVCTASALPPGDTKVYPDDFHWLDKNN